MWYQKRTNPENQPYISVPKTRIWIALNKSSPQIRGSSMRSTRKVTLHSTWLSSRATASLSSFSSVIPSRVNTSILRAPPGSQTVQKSYRLTSSSIARVVETIPYHVCGIKSCIWWVTDNLNMHTNLPDLYFFFRKLYCQFFRKKLKPILHIVKTGKRTEEISNDVLYFLFSQLTIERTRTPRSESLGRFMTCFCHFFSDQLFNLPQLQSNECFNRVLWRIALHKPHLMSPKL